MSKSVLALADNCIDVYPDRRRYYETGNAVDFALSLRAQGQPVSLMTIFGNDLFAASIRALLEERGVDCSHSLTGEKPTSFSSMTLVDGVDRRHLLGRRMCWRISLSRRKRWTMSARSTCSLPMPIPPGCGAGPSCWTAGAWCCRILTRPKGERGGAHAPPDRLCLLLPPVGRPRL